jgi:prepilin-type N-terminal cleavage/methylation domain-containing protein
MMKKQAGFTLIEIAIVLVIIGLLLGGVLKGQELITNSKISRMSNDFNGISAGVFSYLDRYGAYPGDDENAAARWGAPAEAGDGDGLVSGDAFSATVSDESRQVWIHLRQSGLVAGSGTNLPNHAFGGPIGVADSPAGTTIAGNAICMQNIEGKIAEILDRQLDDGIGNTGEMQNDDGTANYTGAELNNSFTICKRI